ncbi:glycosyl transferase family 11 [Methanosphaerula palustris E1-9c]|uniref:Glycosyl transferase family 11 n=2 Tax=Methanosphaerula palustris TaxID=475088 RepID=B8GDY9_METPE|nr:glycosyl transferase family 11 [Methanosphaerula palustris E1-9c]
MIIVRLKGGLGNQLSQYALGRKIAHLHNTELKLDTTWFTTISSDTPRTYRLNNYNIIGTIASAKEIQLIERGRAQGRGYLLSKISDLLTPMYRRTYVRERMHTFDKAILTVPDNVYLDGYWQTEKYFKDIEEILRREVTLKDEPDSINLEMAERIQACHSVSLHVRRGDYVSNPTTQQFHGCCSIDYYNRAISLIEEKVDDPSFFIFSDDLPWAKENLDIPGEKTFVAHNGPEKEYCDLWLMSLCQHHIIANSSFSWWGAWLGQDAEKMVIAPRRWALSESFDTSDIIPDSWITI